MYANASSSSLFSRAAPLLFLALLLAVTFWVYRDGLSGHYILDDRSSVQTLEVLREDPGALGERLSGDRSGMFGRVLPLLSFAAEQMGGAGTPQLSKRNNLLLHLFTGGLVFWLSWLLLAQRGPRCAPWGACIAAGLWLLSPLQVSTTLYIVQRMAMMSTLLVLVALIAWVYVRRAHIAGRRSPAALIICILAVLLAPLAKENGALALPMLLVLDILCLRPATAPWRGNWRFYALPLLLFAAAAGLLFLGWYFEAGYALRRFDLSERVLSESRFLVDYAAQFFWPNLDRLGVYHDDVLLSRGLLAPPTTLLSLLFWGALFALAAPAWWYGRGLVYVALLLLYLGAHSLESTVLALEPYFEHRNYLPSVALALLLGAVVTDLAARYPRALPAMLACCAIYLGVLSLQSAALAHVWGDPLRLAVHHLAGHPDSARANMEMARQQALLGDFTRARAYSEQGALLESRSAASRIRRDADQRLRHIALACLARAPLPEADLAAIGPSDPERPIGETLYLVELKRMLQADVCPGFAWTRFGDHLASLYLESPRAERASAAVYEALAAFANTRGRVDRALAYMQLAVAAQPGDVELTLMRLYFERANGDLIAARGTAGALERLVQEGRLNRRQRRLLEDFKRGLH